MDFRPGTWLNAGVSPHARGKGRRTPLKLEANPVPLTRNQLRVSGTGTPLHWRGPRGVGWRSPVKLLILLAIIAPTLSTLSLPIAAEERAGSALFVYTDSDNVTVWKPVASGSVDVGHATATAHWSTDFISAASVDMVSAASPHGYHEIRNEAGANGGWDFGGGKRLSGSWTVSDEPDFRSQSFGFTGSWEFWARRVTAIVGAGASVADVGRAGDAGFWRNRGGEQASAQASTVLSPTAVLDTVWTVTRASGYLSSPYRFVRLYEPGSNVQETAVAEQVPNQRWRHAATVRLRQRLSRAVFGLVDYRFYADTWGVVAHTLSARASWTHGVWTTSIDVRGYAQGRADFYQSHYDTLPQAPQWRTADKELGPMWTALGGLHMEWQIPQLPGMHIGVGADTLYMRYLDHPFLRERTALMTTVDLGWLR